MLKVDDLNTVLLSYYGTEGSCVCGVNEEIGRIMLDILGMPPQVKRAYGERLRNLLNEWRKKNKLRIDTCISVGVAGGLQKPIHWRACLFLRYALLSDDHIWLASLKKRLHDFIHGSPEIPIISNRNCR